MQGSGERLKVEEKGIDRKHVKRPQVLTSRASQQTQKNKKPGLPAGKEAASEIGIRLLQDQAGVGATGTGRDIVNDAALVRAEHALTWGPTAVAFPQILSKSVSERGTAVPQSEYSDESIFWAL